VSDGVATGQTITGCTSHDNIAADTTYRHGFAFANGASSFSITNSKAWNVDIGLDIQASAGSNSGGTVNYNVFVGKGMGQTEHGTGVFLGAANASYSNSNVDIINNTIVSEDADGQALLIGRYNDTATIQIKNNIITNVNGGNVVVVALSTVGYPTMDYNVYYSTKAKPFSDKGTDLTFEEWKAASGQDAHSIFADPLFRSATDFCPTAAGPGINKGTDVGLTTDGRGLPIRGLPDIGWCEYQPTGGGLGMRIIY
jgi:hypothetical protein